MEKFQKVKQLIQKERFKRIFAENIVIVHEDYYYKTLNLFGTMMYPGSGQYEYVLNNLELIHKYFGDICEIAPTDIFPDPKYKYLIKQKKLDGRIMRVADLKDPYMRQIMDKIVLRNQLFWEQEGKYLDILGTDILWKPHEIHNLIVQDGKIVVFDFGILNRRSTNPFFRMLSYLLHGIQMGYLKFLLTINPKLIFDPWTKG